jgi:hypothetical protein
LEQLSKELKDAVSFWKRNANTKVDMLEPLELQQLHKIKQLGQNMPKFLSPQQTKQAAEQLQDLMSYVQGAVDWLQDPEDAVKRSEGPGLEFSELSKAAKSKEVQDLEKTHELVPQDGYESLILTRIKWWMK